MIAGTVTDVVFESMFAADDSEATNDFGVATPVASATGGALTARQTMLTGSSIEAPQEALTTLRVRIYQAFDRVGHWLSVLPANPVTDLFSGALLLVRRTFNIPTIPKVSVSNVAALESTPESLRQAVFTVSLGWPYDSEVTVGYATVSGAEVDAAIAGEDYTHVVGVLTFAEGETTKQVSVEILCDAVEEPLETFKLIIYAALPPNSAKAAATDDGVAGTTVEFTNVELATAQASILPPGYSAPAVKVSVTNLTGRLLLAEMCGYVGTCTGDLANGQTATVDSSSGRADIGPLTFLFRNEFISAPTFEITLNGNVVSHTASQQGGG